MSISPGTNSRRTLLILGSIFFIAHVALALLYFKERMLQEDAPFYIVKMIQHGVLLCEHNRFSVFLFQWIPLMVFKSGASLEVVTKTYSVSIDLFLFLVFLFSLYALKNNAGALLMLLFLGLAVGRDFFMPISEYSMAVFTALPLFGLAFENSLKKEIRKLILAAFLIIVSINFHPLSLIAIGFILLYQLFAAPKSVRNHWIALGIFTFVVFFLRKLLLPFDNYENNKMNSFSELFHFIFHPAQLKSLAAAINYFTTYFPEMILLFMVSLVVLSLRKKSMLLFFVLLSTYGIAIIFSVIKGGEAKDFWYAEYFILLGLPVFIPLTEYLHQKSKTVITFVLIISSLVCFGRIRQNAPYFENKIMYIERLIRNGSAFPEKRYILNSMNAPVSYISNTWPIPFQTLLLSSFTNKDSAQTFFATLNMDAYDSLLSNNPEFFLGPEWAIDMFDARDNLLRKQVFNLPGSGYRKITGSQKNFIDDSLTFNSSGIKIIVMDSSLTHVNDSLATITIEIINHTGVIIPATPGNGQSIFLSYHTYDSSGQLLCWDNIRTPFECDIHSSLRNALNVKTKNMKPGDFISIDIVHENSRWWGIDSRVRIAE